MIDKKTEKELIEIVKDELDADNYQGIDDLKEIKIDRKNKTATITIGLVEVPEDKYIGFVGY